MWVRVGQLIGKRTITRNMLMHAKAILKVADVCESFSICY